MEYQIFSDSSCDLPLKTIKKYNIKVVPFYISFDGEHYFRENVDITVREFYQKMVDNPNIYPKSSMPSVQDYIDAFTPDLEKGISIICICITTKFSGSYAAAENAKQILLESYSNAKITIINSTINTVLQGLLVLEAANMKQNGLSYEQVIENIERIKSTARIIFTIGSIDYLKKGGRIGKLISVAGVMLNIKPLIILKDGEIFPLGITRSRKKSKQKLISYTKDYFNKLGESPDNYSIAVGYGYDYEEGCEFRDELLKSIKEYSNINEILVYQIGATIGVHTGPHPLGLGIIKKYNM